MRLPAALAAVLPDASELWGEVVELHSGPERHYHDITHVLALAERFAEVADGPGWQGPVEVALAILFHDAVYDATRSDNEERSAAIAVAAIARHRIPADPERVGELIVLTARHGSLTPADVADDPDAGHFLDADMAILAAPGDEFERYEQGVRREYGHVPDEFFVIGRSQFLARVLDSEVIYLTDFFRSRLEHAARANLRSALD